MLSHVELKKTIYMCKQFFYLLLFSEKLDRKNILIEYLHSHNSNEIIDWNNFDGHIVAGRFIYAKQENQFLVLYHNNLKIFIYPDGHVYVYSNDNNTLFATKREILEEVVLDNLAQLKVSDNELISIDIDKHKIGYNERLNLPEHYHFDFRYLFVVDNKQDIKIDINEMSGYK